MKSNYLFLFFAFVFLNSCSKDDEMIKTETENTNIQLRSTNATPSISGISGDKGFNTSYTSNSFSNYYKAELNGGSVISINGSNFGTSTGSVFFEKLTGSTWSTTSSYTVSISSWSSTQIKVKLQTNLTSIPIATARFRVVINGTSYNSPSFATVPYIDTRQYEQCTWWVSKRTRERGLPATNATYDNVNSTINANYVPTADDILSWGTNVHQAFIESVAVSSEPNNVTVYKLTISEANVPWSGNNNSTAPTTYLTTIKVKNTNGVKSFVTGFSTYRSTRTSGATLYKAQ